MSATLGSDSGELSGMRRRVYGSERGSGGNGQGRGVGVGPGIVKAAAASVSARSANTYSQCITQRARMLQRTVAPTALGFSVASTVWLSAWLRFDFSVWSLVAVPLLATLVTLASLLPLLHFSENPALLPSLPAHLLSALVSGLFVKATLISHADWLPFGSNFIILPDSMAQDFSTSRSCTL
ncbi:hypothetical protein BC830DRAFT_170080 [Chytriomyces sp. MP71]|nr:hypothetical protein BC830DRAFT_170080 [Chytriomyces sp. MP71]